jgi:hypothetical protein
VPTSARPAVSRGGDDIDALGQDSRDPLELERGQRRELGGLQHDRVAAASAGRASGRDRSGKFHGTISATTPSGSRNVIATPPETGIVSPSVRSGTPA